MLVKSLVSLAGHDGKSIAAGDHVDWPEKTAKARIKAGVAALPDPGAELGDNVAGLKKMLGDAHYKLGVAERLLKEERDTHAATQDKFDLAAEQFAKERDGLKAELEALKKKAGEQSADLADAGDDLKSVGNERDALAEQVAAITKERDALKADLAEATKPPAK